MMSCAWVVAWKHGVINEHLIQATDDHQWVLVLFLPDGKTEWSSPKATWEELLDDVRSYRAARSEGAYAHCRAYAFRHYDNGWYGCPPGRSY